MIKLAILSLLVVGCVHAAPVATLGPAAPNAVCAMIAFAAPAAKCTLADDALRAIVKVESDGGVKYCWLSYDQNGYGCATFALSKGETAQVAVEQERKRAEQEAAAKAKAEAAKAVEVKADAKPETSKVPTKPLASTVIPTKGAPKP